MDKLKLSLQIAVLSGNDQSSGSSGGSSSDASTVISVDCSSIDSGISLINSYISKQINLSHCKAIIMSEEFATNGVSDVIYGLVTNVQIRPDCNVIISKCDASDYLEQSTPIFESNPANYYELILNSTEYSGYVADIYLYDFYSSILSTASEACTILGGINTEETHNQDTDSTQSLDGNYKAGQTPIKSKNKVETIGSAVFVGDKLVGELNNIETLCYLITINELESATVTIPNPFKFDSNISVNIKLNKDTKNKVSLVNDFPYIECDVFVTGNVFSMEPSIDLNNSKDLEIINSYVSTYLEDILYSYLYRTSKEFNSDISGFGKYALQKYLTWEDWIDSDWLINYENTFFKVNVDVDLQGGYLFTEI